MIDFLSPITQERQKPVAVSYEAESVRQHTKSSHFLFIKNSVFITEMYKQKLKQRFDLYNSIWQNETMFSSSISEITNNAAYRSIIGLGEDVNLIYLHFLLLTRDEYLQKSRFIHKYGKTTMLLMITI